MMDVDSFKAYNDHYGHAAGDECLKSVAGVLSQSVLRTSDTIARYGGEEFVAVLPETDLEGAVQVAERMRFGITEANLPHAYSPADDHVTLSFGVACIMPSNDRNEAELAKGADDMVYAVKESGRNGIKTIDLG